MLSFQLVVSPVEFETSLVTLCQIVGTGSRCGSSPKFSPCRLFMKVLLLFSFHTLAGAVNFETGLITLAQGECYGAIYLVEHIPPLNTCIYFRDAFSQDSGKFMGSPLFLDHSVVPRHRKTCHWSCRPRCQSRFIRPSYVKPSGIRVRPRHVKPHKQDTEVSWGSDETDLPAFTGWVTPFLHHPTCWLPSDWKHTIDHIDVLGTAQLLIDSNVVIECNEEQVISARVAARVLTGENNGDVERAIAQTRGSDYALTTCSSAGGDLPVIIDTGATTSLACRLGDFIGELRPVDITIHGIGSQMKVMGIGTVRWKIMDQLGVVEIIETEAYFLPETTVNLFSPQSYIQEASKGEFPRLTLDRAGTILTTKLGTDLSFPYHFSNNLPMMMRAPFDENLATLGSAGAFRVDLSADSIIGAVLEDSNTNIDGPQKELLHWHGQFGHGGFQKVQAMMEPCHPHSTSVKSGPSPNLKGV